MAELPDDEGTIIALLERFRTQRLPMMLEIKERVDRGETLTERDIEMMALIFEHSRDEQAIAQRHPELAGLVGRVTALYKEITDRALENEKSAS